MANPLLSPEPGQTHLLLGNEAIVRGALEAGVAFVSCYPGTPSSEVPDTFFRLASDSAYGDRYYFEYSVNEKVALEVAGGATLAGAMTLCTMKHVGVNVAADPLMTLCYIGSPGGLLLLSADDPGCHSSQNEQDNRIYARLAGMPTFEPTTAQEAKDMTRDALLLSKATGQPVMLRTTTRLNHLRGPVTFGPLPAPAKAEGFKKNPMRFVPIPAVARMRHPALLKAMDGFAEAAETSPWNSLWTKGVATAEAAQVGVISTGMARAFLRDVVEEIGYHDAKGLRVLELGFSHPLPKRMLTGFLSGLSTVVVLEELEPLVESAIRELAFDLKLDVQVVGKSGSKPHPMLTRLGEYSTTNVRAVLREVLNLPTQPVITCEAETIPALAPDALPKRPPNLCAGCPHRATYYAVRQVFGDSAVYSSDIGCYTLGILPPLMAADFLLCMGSSIPAGGGLAKASGQTAIAFIGDSTFFHTGVTGLINAVFNDHDVIVVILDNRTTAMTGHQPNPGVIDTLTGPNPRRMDIETIVRGCGVTQVEKLTPLNQKKLVNVLETFKAGSGVRVLIADEACPLHERRTKKAGAPARVAAVLEECDGCMRCLTDLACPAFVKVETEAGERPKVVASLCSGCMLCLQVCTHIKSRKAEEVPA